MNNSTRSSVFVASTTTAHIATMPRDQTPNVDRPENVTSARHTIWKITSKPMKATT